MDEEKSPERLPHFAIHKNKDDSVSLTCSNGASWENLKKHLSTFLKNNKTTMDSIQTLHVVCSNIITFPRNSFSDFPNLTSLKVLACKIITLSTEDFSKIPKLKELIFENDIKEIPSDFFNKLSSLELVDFTRCKIQEIQKDIFNPLKNLKQLSLAENEIKNLNPGVFNGLDALENLDLSENKLDNLEESVFKDLKNLKELNLSYNFLECEALPALNCLENLQDLNLDGNKLLEFSSVMLAKLKKLRRISLEEISISRLQEDFSLNFGLIEVLKLSQNPLKEIDPKAFQGLLKIKKIHFNFCQFTNLHPELFKHIKSKNDLELAFTGNTIKSLPQDIFASFSKITILNLEDCKIETIEAGTFKGMASLIELHLEFNFLRKLHAGMFDGLAQLRRLELESNKIEILEEGCFKDLKSLDWLNLDGNLLTTFNGSCFKNLNSLKSLLIPYNLIKNIDSLEGLENLRFLDLSYNSLAGDLENRFEGANELSYLYLKGCGLKSIGALSSGILSKLVMLDLTDNEIEKLSLEFFKHISPLCIVTVLGNKIPNENFTEIFKEHPNITLIHEDPVK